MMTEVADGTSSHGQQQSQSSTRNRRFSMPTSSRSASCSGDDALNKLLAAAEACEIIEEMEVTEGQPPQMPHMATAPAPLRPKRLSSSSCYTPRSDDRKLLHKLSEQKRRDTLKDRLEALKDIIPGLRAEARRNDTIQTVLSKSVEYIHYLEDRNEDWEQLEHEIQREEMYNHRLTIEINHLIQEEKALCVL